MDSAYLHRIARRYRNAIRGLQWSLQRKAPNTAEGKDGPTQVSRRIDGRHYTFQPPPIAPKRVALSGGQAFVLSGQALDEMTRYSDLAIEIPEPAGPLADWIAVAGDLCDSLISQWTTRQAEIICFAIDPREPNAEKIARSLKQAVSKQAVTKALRGANWHAVRAAIRQFEETPWRAVLGIGKADNQKWLFRLRQPKMVVGTQTTKNG